MGQTIIEKIVSAHANKQVKQNEIAIVNVDGVMATDTTAPLTIKAFQDMGGWKVWDAKRFSLLLTMLHQRLTKKSQIFIHS